MKTLARILVGIAGVPLFLFGLVDVLFAKDLFGAGSIAQFSGGLAVLTAVSAWLLATQPTTARQVSTILLSFALSALRLVRFVAVLQIFMRWELTDGILFGALIGAPPVLVLVLAIMIRPNRTHREAAGQSLPTS